MRAPLRSILLVLWVCYVLVGCSRPQTTVRLMLQADDAEFKKIRQIIAVFEEYQPGINVEVVRVGPEKRVVDELLADRALGRPPDLFIFDLFDLPLLHAQGMLKDLTGKVDDLFDFQPRLTECFVLDGRLLAVPAACSPQVLYYNTQKFDRAGVPHPSGTWDWTDLRLAAEKLTLRESPSDPVIQYGLELDPGFRTWAAFLWQNGGELTDPETGRWVLGAPAYVEKNAAALEYYVGLIHESKLSPARSALQGAPAGDSFGSQMAAMTFAGRPLSARLVANPGLHWNVSPMPRNRKRATTLFVEGYGILPETKHFEEAWKLLRHLTGPTSQTKLAMTGRMVPSRVSVGQSRVFLDFPGGVEILNKAFVDSLYSARPLPVWGHWPDVEQIVMEETDLLFSAAKGSAREALIKAQLRIDKLVPADSQRSSSASTAK